MTQVLPQWRCHKVVSALKIKRVLLNHDGSATIVPADSAFGSFVAPKEWTSRFKWESADVGYYVVYDDGYASWSPTKAFEEGYTRL